MVKRNLFVRELEELLTFGGSEIAPFVEDVVGGQEHLGLDEVDASIAQQGGGVHDGFAGIGRRPE